MQAFDDPAEQAAAANREDHGIGSGHRARKLVDHGGMAVPQQGVVEGVEKGVRFLDHRQRQDIGFVPGGAVDDDLGSLLP